MPTYTGASGKSYTTRDNPFAQGGEGSVYSVRGHSDIVIKIYKPEKLKSEPERADKLRAMVKSGASKDGQCAWPLDVLTEGGRFVGFVMPKVSGKCKLREIYSYSPKRSSKPWPLFITIAKNLSAAVNSVHESGQVIGDLNPDNIMVDPNDGMVTLVDADSYHIKASGITYRCNVGMPEFVAPELQGKEFKSAPLPTFTSKTDSFALSVLVFALLMNGAHPFACKTHMGSASSFQPVDNIRKGLTPFFPDSKGANLNITIPAYAPDLSCLPKRIRDLFHRAFVEGHGNPSKRPGADEWYYALEELEKSIARCPVRPQHLYYKGSGVCPWCEVDRKMNNAVTKSYVSVRPRTGARTNTGSSSTSGNTGSSYSSNTSYNSGSTHSSGSAITYGGSGTRSRRAYRTTVGDVLWSIGDALLEGIGFIIGIIVAIFKAIFSFIIDVCPFLIKPVLVILFICFLVKACAHVDVFGKLTDHLRQWSGERDRYTSPSELEEAYELSLTSYTCIKADAGVHGRVAQLNLNTGDEVSEYMYSSAPYNAIYWDIAGNFDNFTGIWAIRQTERDTEKYSDFDIIADGEIIYSSPSITGGDLPVTVSVDISGCNVLAIMFKNGTGEAVLADVKLSNDEPREAEPVSEDGYLLPDWLTDLEPIYETSGVNVRSDSSGKAIDGTTYSHYLFAYDEDEGIAYRLDGRYERITGLWTICYSDRDTDKECSFRIYADDECVYSSPVLTGGDDPVYVDADLDGCTLLTIKFTGGTGQGEFGNVCLWPSGNASGEAVAYLMHPGSGDVKLKKFEYFKNDGFVACPYSEDMNTGENAEYFLCGDEGSSIEYYLGGEYSEFAGTWTIKQFNRDTTYDYEFEVYADGDLIYTSPVITGGMLPETFRIDVSGCNVMKIVITSGGDGAMIAEPFLVY